MERVPVYTLKALSAKENISYGHLRRLIAAMGNEEPKTWRSYQLVRVGDVKTWFAYPIDAGIQFITE